MSELIYSFVCFVKYSLKKSLKPQKKKKPAKGQSPLGYLTPVAGWELRTVHSPHVLVNEVCILLNTPDLGLRVQMPSQKCKFLTKANFVFHTSVKYL